MCVWRLSWQENVSLKVRVRELEAEVGVLRQELVQAGREVPIAPVTVYVEGT
jgi:hypothetical protein